MRYTLLLLTLLSCASRYENFDSIKPGMTKMDLREEMSMVEGMLNFPPYEFRTYSEGMVILKDDEIISIGPLKHSGDFDVAVTSKVLAPHPDQRYFVQVSKEGQYQLAREQLELLLRVRGYTMVEEAKARAVIHLEFKSTSLEDGEFEHRFVMKATSEKRPVVWQVETSTRTTLPQSEALPSLMSVAVDYIQMPLREKKSEEVRATNVAANVIRDMENVKKILEKDATLKKSEGP